MSDMGGQLRQLIGQLSVAQRIWIAGAALASVALLFAFVTFAGQPDYQAAFTRLSPSSAGSISEALRTAKIPFQVADAGATILVPSSRISDARVAAGTTAGASGDAQGFELFDKAGFGMSEFDQQVAYQRALQGELTTTIQSMDGVDTARVAIVPAQQGLFADQDRAASASVMVQMRDGSTPSASMVRGITTTVAGAVPGLTADNVTVVDEKGRVLSGPGDAVTADAMTAQAQIERDTELKVEELLAQALGPNHASVSVAATMDLEKVEQQVTTYTPVTSNQWTPVSVNRVTETYGNGSESSSGGIPGSGSNVPGLPTYPGLPSPTPAPSGSPSPSASPSPSTSPAASTSPAPSASAAANASPAPSNGYQRQEETVNYNLSETVQHIVREPGSVKRLSVAVLVDQAATSNLSADTLSKSIAAAIGIDPSRGDVISVSAVPFAAKPADTSSAGLLPQGVMDQAGGVASSALGIVLGLVLLFLLWRNTRALRRRSEEMAFLTAGAQPAGALGPGMAAAAIGGMGSTPEIAEGTPHAQIQQQLRMVADQRPDALVNLMNQWLLEDQKRR